MWPGVVQTPGHWKNRRMRAAVITGLLYASSGKRSTSSVTHEVINVTVYLITYDLNREVRRPPIVKFIKDNFPWAKLSESSYAIASDMTAVALRDLFNQFVDQNDNLFVVTLTLPWAGRGPQDVLDWLKQYMPLSLPQAA